MTALPVGIRRWLMFAIAVLTAFGALAALLYAAAQAVDSYPTPPTPGRRRLSLVGEDDGMRESEEDAA